MAHLARDRPRRRGVGWLIFTGLLGIGDDDVFDLGGLLSAIIGVLIVLPIAGVVLRRTGLSPERTQRPDRAAAQFRAICRTFVTFGVDPFTHRAET